MALTVHDIGFWIEAECYALMRLEEKTGPDNGPTIYPKQVASVRHRLWRIHQLLEELAGPQKDEAPF